MYSFIHMCHFSCESCLSYDIIYCECLCLICLRATYLSSATLLVSQVKEKDKHTPHIIFAWQINIDCFSFVGWENRMSNNVPSNNSSIECTQALTTKIIQGKTSGEILYPCSIKTREVLGNPSPTLKRFPETREISRGRSPREISRVTIYLKKSWTLCGVCFICCINI